MWKLFVRLPWPTEAPLAALRRVRTICRKYRKRTTILPGGSGRGTESLQWRRSSDTGPVRGPSGRPCCGLAAGADGLRLPPARGPSPLKERLFRSVIDAIQYCLPVGECGAQHREDLAYGSLRERACSGGCWRPKSEASHPNARAAHGCHFPSPQAGSRSLQPAGWGSLPRPRGRIEHQAPMRVHGEPDDPGAEVTVSEPRPIVRWSVAVPVERG